MVGQAMQVSELGSKAKSKQFDTCDDIRYPIDPQTLLFSLKVAQLASMFPFYCTVYMMAPDSEIGQFSNLILDDFLHFPQHKKYVCYNANY